MMNTTPIINLTKQFNIIYNCCYCGLEIHTYWNPDKDCLDGQWMSLDSNWSEIFHTFVADPQSVVCTRCFTEGQCRRNNGIGNSASRREMCSSTSEDRQAGGDAGQGKETEDDSRT